MCGVTLPPQLYVRDKFPDLGFVVLGNLVRIAFQRQNGSQRSQVREGKGVRGRIHVFARYILLVSRASTL